ncbi:MAG: tetratricopeptide repeat protein [Anaerolineae bacterium]|jgi:serine/threonine protein kinase/tetratricopeptide (TPR) repeat protein|nr:tetratricopeptide repeat protein [Anaerolineae bacterium]
MQDHYRYQVEAYLAKGGMGAVYQVYDRLRKQSVALKRLPIALAADDERFSALIDEFRALVRLRHPNIIQVLDFGFVTEAGSTHTQPYFTMEFLPEARPITEVVKDPTQALTAATEMLQALAYLHRNRMIHRDLKPANVLMNAHGVKVLDFGLADDLTRSERPSSAGTVMYSAPEILMNQLATIQSDLYAVGVILYQLFSGHYPFPHKSASDLITQILCQMPAMTPFSPPLAALLSELLDKDPAARPSSVTEVIIRLHQAVNQPLPPQSLPIRESFLQASRFVGHEREIEELRAALIQLRDQRTTEASAILIGGESGVGKSRLLEEIAARALIKGLLVLRGQTSPNAGLPYQVWHESILELNLTTPFDPIEASILKEIAPDLGVDVVNVPALSGEAARKRLAVTVIGILKRQARPVVILLEDLHWAQESLLLLQEILTLRDQVPNLLVIGTYRDDERPQLPDELSAVTVIKLGRLGKTEIDQLVYQMLGHADEQINTFLSRETGGNAFFMVEMMRALAEESGGLDGVGQLPMPANLFTRGLGAVIARRLARVPESARALLQRAAIAGRTFDLAVLARVADLPIDDFLTLTVNAGVIELAQGQWRFQHDKWREGVIEALTEDQKRTFNREIAIAIETTYPDNPRYHELLLAHWQDAHDSEAALRYLLPVAERLVHYQADYRRAVILIQQGLTLLAEGDVHQVTLLHLLIRAYHGLTDYSAAQQYVRQAQTLTLTPHQQADNLYLSALINAGLNHPDQAEADQQAALAMRREIGDQEGIGASLNNLGTHAILRGNLDMAEAYLRESLGVQRSIQHLRGIATVLSNLAAIWTVQGRFQESRDSLEESLSLSQVIFDRQNMAYTLGNLGNLMLSQADHPAAEHYYREALTIFTEIGERFGIAAIAVNLGTIIYDQGRYDEAKHAYQHALELFTAIQVKDGIAEAYKGLGDVAIAQGDSQGAFAALTQALTLYRELDRKAAMITIHQLLAQLHLEMGESEAGRVELCAGLDLALMLSLEASLIPLLLLAARGWCADQADRIGSCCAGHPAFTPKLRQQWLEELTYQPIVIGEFTLIDMAHQIRDQLNSHVQP